MLNLQKGGNFSSFNAVAKSSADGPSLAEIRNVEVQKSAPAEENLRETVSPSESDEKTEEDETAA